MQVPRTDRHAHRREAGRHLRLAFPAQPQAAGAARRAVSGLMSPDVPDERRDAVLLAVSEAVTNAVVHGYDDDDEGTVELFAIAVDGQLILTVDDVGRGLTAPARQPGLGMGLRLIRDAADVAVVAAGPGGGTSVQCLFSLRDRDRETDDAQSRRSAA